MNVAALATLGLLLLLAASCSGQSAAPPGADPTEPTSSLSPPPSIYAPTHIVEVSLELPPADWDTLRTEGRGLFDVFRDEGADYEYTELVGTAIVDGQRYEAVTVRKKGYLGSLSRLRPSLRLDFGEGAPGGLRRLTLNNNRQDPSHARQCLAYRLFERAGLPAPACNLAHVSVNGEDLGTYTNVEPIRKPFLARYFPSDEGNLYEGQLVDFVAEDVPRFQLKTNEAENDRGDLERLVSAVETPGYGLAAALEGAIDLEQFRDFWALEVLAGHWDGYDGNRNNYYVYSDPSSDRLHFIPWGTDGAFAETSPTDALNPTRTVYANGRIASRLYGLPVQRERFRTRLGELVDELWDVPWLVGELEQLSEQAGDAWPAATRALRQHLETHGARVREELAQPAWEWVDEPSEPSPCDGRIEDVSIGFATDYGDLAALAPGVGGFDVSLRMDGEPFEGSWFGRAGVDAMSADPSVVLRFLGFLANGRGVFVQLTLPPAEFAPGARSLYALESYGLVVSLAGAQSRLVGFISDGMLELTDASRSSGAPVIGRLQAKLLQLACAEL